MIKKILIVNTHSALNAGDAAIVLSQVRFLRRRYGPVAIGLTSRTPELDRKAYAAEKVDVFAPILPAPSIYAGVRAKLVRTARDPAKAGPRRDLGKAVAAADLVVASGGSYFWASRGGIPGSMFHQNIRHIRAAERAGKPVIVFPQSFGPRLGRAHARMLRKTLEHDAVTKIFAREEVSAEYLAGLLRGGEARNRVELCPDVAFLLDKEPCPHPAADAEPPLPHPVCAITLRRWNFPGVRGRAQRREHLDRYLHEIAHFCEHLTMDFKGSVLIYPQSLGPGVLEDDRPISRAFEALVRRDIPQVNIRYVEPELGGCLDGAWAALAGCDFTIATRLHSAILAMTLGLPSLTIGYQPKTSGTMKLLGLEHCSFEIACLQATHLVAAMTKILEAPARHRDEVRQATARTRAEIEEKLTRACPGGAPVSK